MRVGPGLDFVLDEKTEVGASSLEDAKRLEPGAGLSNQAGVYPLIFGILEYEERSGARLIESAFLRRMSDSRRFRL